MMMSNESRVSKRHLDTPRDKPVTERFSEHGNLDRPGAQAHPRARVGWAHPDATMAWRQR